MSLPQAALATLGRYARHLATSGMIVAWAACFGCDDTDARKDALDTPVADASDDAQDTGSGTGDPEVQGPDAPGASPTIAITSPEDGALASVGTVVALQAHVVDGDTPSQQLTVTWSSDPDGVIGTTTPTAGGDTRLEVAGLSVGLHRLDATVTDESGHEATASITLTINAPPDRPTVTISPDHPTTNDDLEAVLEGVSDPNRAATDLTVAWHWSKDGVEQSDLRTSSVRAARTQKGETWEVRVTVSDGHAVSDVAVDSVVIANTVPTCGSVTLTPAEAPAEATTTSELVCTCVTRADADGDAPEDLCAFYDGTALLAEVPPNEQGACHLDPSLTAKGMAVTCSFEPSDGEAQGPVTASSAVSIGNTAPTAPVSVALTPTVAEAGSELSCAIAAPSEDPDGDAITYETTWFVGAHQSAGATSATLLAASLARDDAGATPRHGDSIRCEMRASDGVSSSEPTTSNAVVLGNSAPIGGHVTLSPTSASETTTLTCDASDAVDLDGDAITWTFSWEVGESAVAGETGSTLTGAHFDKGDDVRCLATASDGAAAGPTLASDPVVTITNTLPSIASASVTPSTFANGDTLTCNYQGWADPDPADGTPLVAYAWFVDKGTDTPELVGRTTPTITPPVRPAGTKFFCRVSPVNAEGHGASVDSGPAVVLNSKPTVASAVLTPSDGVVGSVLTCSANALGDPDADAVVARFAWLKGTEPISGANGPTLAALFQKGDAIRCSVTPWDGALEGTPALSNAVTIGNTLPVVADAALTPASAATCTVFACDAAAPVDPDAGDTLLVRYRWTRNGEALPDDTRTLRGESMHIGDVLQCFAAATDGTLDAHLEPLFGPEVASNTAVVTNAKPSIASASISPAAPNTGALLSCVPASWSDPDCGASPSYAFKWYRGASVIAGATSATFATTGLAPDTQIACQAIPFDGLEYGDARLSPAVTLANAPPTAAVVALSAPSGADGPVTCTLATPATDLGPITYTWRWRINSAPSFEGAQTLTAAQVAHCDVVTCEAIASDGFATSTSNTATLQLPLGSDCADGNACTIDACAAGGGCAPPSPAPPGVVTIAPATAYETSTLTCLPGSNTSCGFAVAWSVSGLPSGASSSLTGSAFNKGDQVSCSLRPSAGGDAVGSEVKVIADTPPIITSVALTAPTPIREASTLGCAVVGFQDADGDANQTTTRWLVNGSQVATGATLTGASFRKGDQIVCSATARAAGIDGNTVSSAAVTVANTAPRVGSVNVTPSPAKVTDNLQASALGVVDDDGDPVTLDYRWYVGAAQKASGAIVSGTKFKKGDAVVVDIVPFDGTAYGASARSQPVSISNSPPSMSSVSIGLPEGATVATKTTTLTAQAYGADPDGDAVTGTFAWKRGDTLIGSDTSLPTSAFNRGDSITLTVTPTDGSLSGSPLTSAPVVIQNSLPTTPVVQVTPSAPGDVENLVCTIGAASTDADGDPITYQITWYNRGVATSYAATGVSASASVTVPASATARGDVWTCRIAASDAAGPGASSEVSVEVSDLSSAQASGLMLRMSFEGDFSDRSGNGHAGTVSGTSPTFINACAGKAAHFGGAGRLSLANSAALGPRSGGPRTVAAWVRANVAAGEFGNYAGQYNNMNPGDSLFFVAIETSQSPARFEATGNGTNALFTTPAGGFGTFRHLVAVYDPAQSKAFLYVDGVLATSGSIAFSASSSKPFEVGGLSTAGNFKGDLDELMVFDRALSATEVAQLTAAVQCGAPASDNCGGVTYEGCCTAQGTVRWCDQGQLYTSDCAAQDTTCGWASDTSGGAYYCANEASPGPASAPYLCAGETCLNTCAGRECGYQCGQSCGTCGSGEVCTADGQCEPDRCGTLDYYGCCSGSVSVWCQDNQILTASCDGAGSTGCGWTDGVGYYCGGVNDDPSGTYPRACEIPICATQLLDDTIVHQAELQGAMPERIWVGVGATSIGIQSSGAAVDDLVVRRNSDAVVLLEDNFDDATIWLSRSGAIGLATVLSGVGIFTADWGRLERTGDGVATGTGFSVSIDTYWAAQTNHHDMVIHRSASALPAWDNAWFRASIELGKYASQNVTPFASFALEPRDAVVTLHSSTPLAATPTLGWHTQTVRFEVGHCVSTVTCPGGTTWDPSAGYCATPWTDIATFSGNQQCGPQYYQVTLPFGMNEFRPRAASSVSGGFLAAVTTLDQSTLWSFSPNGETSICNNLWGDDQGVWSAGIRRTAGPTQAACTSPMSPPPAAYYLRGCGIYAFAIQGRGLVPPVP